MADLIFKYDFSWGNPYFLLDILNSRISITTHSILDMAYGPYDGNPDLIKNTHDVIYQTTNQRYQHILITNGASGALNLILRRFKAKNGQKVFTTPYGYPSYDSFINRAGLERVRNLNAMPLHLTTGNHLYMRLIDSPENPTGTQYNIGDANTDTWDSVYNNQIYTKTPFIVPNHRVMVGSYSKLLGIAGARIGFIATNDLLLYEDLKIESKAEYTGVSKLSQELIVSILKQIDLNQFMRDGSNDLADNKYEFTKLEYLFDGQRVNEVGMFYCAKIHPKARDLLDKCGVGYVMLDDDTIRLSMGQTKKITQEGIQYILKKDRVQNEKKTK